MENLNTEVQDFLRQCATAAFPKMFVRVSCSFFFFFFFFIFIGGGEMGRSGIVRISVSQEAKALWLVRNVWKKKSTFVRERNIFQVFVKPNYAKRHTSETAIKMFYFLRNSSKGNPLFLPLHTDLQRTESCRGIFEDCIAAANKLVSILGTNL